jgi:hypothetical protein
MEQPTQVAVLVAVLPQSHLVGLALLSFDTLTLTI